MRLVLSSHSHWWVAWPPGKGPVSDTGTSSAATSQPTASVPLPLPCVGSSRSRAVGKAVLGEPRTLSAQEGRKEIVAALAAAAGQWCASDKDLLSACQECSCLWILCPLSFLSVFCRAFSDSFQTLFSFVFFSPVPQWCILLTKIPLIPFIYLHLGSIQTLVMVQYRAVW